jgi:Secretion system C-terminal sorting domain/NHL repeat
MKKLFLLLFLIPILAKAQIISTVAGNGFIGYSGDGGPATLAELHVPTGVSVDKYGNIYIADLYNGVIRKVDVLGSISTIAGIPSYGYDGDGGAATSVWLKRPYRVAVDISGNIYIADAFSNKIRKVDELGIITAFAGTGERGYSGDGGPASSAKLYLPYGLNFDNLGNLYIAEEGNNVIRKIDSRGIITTVAGNGFSYNDSLGNTHGAYDGDNGPATLAKLNSPLGVSVDNNGNIYIADADNRAIRRVDAVTGLISTFAGRGGSVSDDVPATSGYLNIPTDVLADSVGNVFIVDWMSGLIKMVNASGLIRTIAGKIKGGLIGEGDGGPATNAVLYRPSGISSDVCGNLYIADAMSHRIRKITYNGDCVFANESVPNVSKSKSVSAFNIYPNPVQRYLTIAGTINKVSEVKIINLIGETVYSHTANASKVLIDVADLPSGVYYVKVNGAEVRKFVKQ